MSEQWTGDWMRDAETGQLIDGPAMNRYEMFMLIRELRAVIHAHAQTIRDKQAVIDELEGTLPGRIKGAQALADEKCRCFLMRAETAEARLAVYSSGGFADADALAAAYLDVSAERDAMRESAGTMSDLSKQFISSIPITHMSRPQWIQFKDAIERLHSLEEENGRLKAPVSDAEWLPIAGKGSIRDTWRKVCDKIIAARAKEPTPTP